MSQNIFMLHDTALSFVHYIGLDWIVLSWTDYIKDNFSIKSHILNNADNLEKALIYWNNTLYYIRLDFSIGLCMFNQNIHELLPYWFNISFGTTSLN